MRHLALPLALSLLPVTLHAQSLVEANDPYRLMSLLREAGYAVELTTDNVGDPRISAALNGTNFSVYFYDCENGTACKTLQFSAGFDLRDGLSLESANSWNREKRYGTVYLDEENDPYLQMDVNIDYGVTEENFVDNFNLYTRLLEDFEDYIDW